MFTLRRWLPAITLLALASSALALAADEQVWQPFHGITLKRIDIKQPTPLVIHVATINLAAEGISFLVTPGNGDPNGDEPGDPNRETTRQTTLEMLSEQQAQLAINATFFDMSSLDTDNQGLVVSNGQRISPFRGDWPAINIDPDRHVAIVRGAHDTYQVTQPPQGIKLHNAVSGSHQIVADGKPTVDDGEFSTTAHPRTAIGYTADRKLVLVTVDGRQAGVSEGMSLEELAELMIELGCIQALNLDGGGSTTMAIADPDPRVLNTPSSTDETGKPGVLRKNGTSLAVFAQPHRP